MDLACGTGQVALALYRYFNDVWAIDQEDESVAFARNNAEKIGVSNFSWVDQRAEDVDADRYSYRKPPSTASIVGVET